MMLRIWSRPLNWNCMRHAVFLCSVAKLVVLLIVGVGCGGETLESEGDQGVEVHANTVTPTVMTDTPKASAEEQVAAERMLAEAMADGLMTAEEFELLALEAVECTKRAGFEASLDAFNAEFRYFSSSVRNVDQTGNALPGEDPAEIADEACSNAYFYPAWDAFEITNPRSEEDIRRLEKQREQAVLDCLRESGIEFETFDDYLAGLGDVHPDVHIPCAQAYNE